MIDAFAADQIRAAIRAACERTGLTPTALARSAGLAPSTINRFLAGGEFKCQPSTRTLGKLDSAIRGVSA